MIGIKGLDRFEYFLLAMNDGLEFRLRRKFSFQITHNFDALIIGIDRFVNLLCIRIMFE